MLLLIKMKMRPPSQPLNHAMITHGSSDAMGNLVEHASLVKEAYWEKGRNCLKDVVRKVSKNKPTDVIPWLSPDVQRQLLHHKHTNEGFLKRSRQSRLNKITGPKAETHHTQGSISTVVIAKKMVQISFSWETVTTAKLFSNAHTNPKDKTLADDRSGYMGEIPVIEIVKQVPPLEEDSSLFLEAVGGWSEKGTIYGLGNSVSLFCEKPTNTAIANKPSYTPSIIAQLQTELDSMMTELNSTKNEIQQRSSREEQQWKMAE
ncbi:hypothetical protein Cgig2_027016 [Carnegiea gigantea]|uniref:Uncharacterized protein n=1 Tax=Carnegiea gigantea TaxID=171969 RepID=A0A9Q1JF84_9CARY|nr:hypothetical protein Cgig2_027016 [Carnegiea gigantea]